MIKSRWFYHPLFVFIFSLVALALSLFLYIRSYLRVNEALNEVMIKYNMNAARMLEAETWVLILTLSLLVAVILAGLLIIYIYYQKMIQLYRLQQNFINGFTHELKTPIASLHLFLETMSKHELEREQELKYLEIMKRDVKRLSDNVSRILHLGRLEDKDFKAEFKQADIVMVVQNFIQSTPHLFEEGVVEFSSEVKSYEMLVDIALFEMLLMNLITNGFIYNSSKEKKIVISIYMNNQKMHMTIKDNGHGISKEEQKKIFRKFYQVGKTTKGSGLGLFIAQSIVKIHKGEIELMTSKPGEGSTFLLTFKKG